MSVNEPYRLLRDVRKLEADWGQNEGEAIDLANKLADALENALEGLYKVYVNLGEDTDGARNADQFFGAWVAFDPAKHIPDLVKEHRTEWENSYEEGYADGQRYAHG